MATTITVIMSTTQTKGSLLFLMWVSWVGVLLALLGTPRTVGRLSDIPSESIHTVVLTEQPVSKELLDAYITQRASGTLWFETSEEYNAMALVLLQRAEKETNRDEKKRFYEHALAWQRQALKVGPSDPYGWFRMAYLNYVQDGPSESVADAWRLSYLSAPYELRLMIPRIQMALSLGKILDEESRKKIPILIRESWEDDPYIISDAAKQGYFISVVEEALRERPEDVKKFRENLKD